jgi:enolase-phosphatase E1
VASGLPSTIRAVLLDIEGTTTPISFVHDVLFSYARLHVRSYLAENLDSPEVTKDLANLKQEHHVDEMQDPGPPPLVSVTRSAQIDSLVAYVNWLMDRDRKSTGLKSLQGRIWKEGYSNETLKAQVFADVPRAFDRWRRAGLSIHIFSSGSSLAQQLLFAHTESGDLSRFIANYFDTTVGAKQDSASYRKIAEVLRQQTSDVLFISDIVGELDAADAASMHPLLIVRPGNQSQPSAERYRRIESFDGVLEAGF